MSGSMADSKPCLCRGFYICGSWDVGLFLCQLMFVAIYFFRLIAFLFSFHFVFMFPCRLFFLWVTLCGTFY